MCPWGFHLQWYEENDNIHCDTTCTNYGQKIFLSLANSQPRLYVASIMKQQAARGERD